MTHGFPKKNKLSYISLNTLKDYKTAPKKVRDESNYHTAVIKTESVNGVHPNGIEMVTKYAVYAPFLKNYNLITQMRLTSNGNIVLKGLAPGMDSKSDIHNTYYSIQANTSSLRTQLQNWTSQAKWYHTTQPIQMTIAKWSCSASMPLFINANFSWPDSVTRNNQSRSSRWQPKTSSKLRTMSLKRPQQSSLAATLQSGIANMAAHTRTPPKAMYVKSVSQRSANYRDAATTYDAEYAENDTKRQTVRKTATTTTTASPVEWKGTYHRNAHSAKVNLITRINCDFALFLQYTRTRIATKSNPWQNERTEEAKAKIYRIPPPGNTTLRQLPIKSFFQNLAIDNEKENTTTSDKDVRSIKILQWNARSLNEPKATELAQLAKKRGIDVICISELGYRRQIPGFPHYSQSQADTQSAIFWRSGLRVKDITFQINIKIPRMQIQCIEIEDDISLIHTYIPPEVGFRERKQLWSALYQLLITEKLLEKTLITGDLNTLDTRFGINHKEKHPYLDEVLAPAGPLRIISDRNSFTRETHTLDITLGTQAAKKDVEEWKVLHRFDSDHYPTLITIRSNGYPLNAAEDSKHPKQNTWIVLDCKQTEKKLLRRLETMEENDGNLEQLTITLKDAVTEKTIKYKPISFWNSTLNKAKNQRNRARHEIVIARNKGLNTQRRVIKYKRKNRSLRKLSERQS
jgi:hypothetical protein